MLPFSNLDKRLRGKPLRTMSKFDLTHKRAQKFLDSELAKSEEKRNPELLEKLKKVLGI